MKRPLLKLPEGRASTPVEPSSEILWDEEKMDDSLWWQSRLTKRTDSENSSSFKDLERRRAWLR